MSYAHSLQNYGPGCGVFGRSRHPRKCGSCQYQCGGDGRQRRGRFPIARPRSRGSPTLHSDAASNAVTAVVREGAIAAGADSVFVK